MVTHIFRSSSKVSEGGDPSVGGRTLSKNILYKNQQPHKEVKTVEQAVLVPGTQCSAPGLSRHKHGAPCPWEGSLAESELLGKKGALSSYGMLLWFDWKDRTHGRGKDQKKDARMGMVQRAPAALLSHGTERNSS